VAKLLTGELADVGELPLACRRGRDRDTPRRGRRVGRRPTAVVGLSRFSGSAGGALNRAGAAGARPTIGARNHRVTAPAPKPLHVVDADSNPSRQPFRRRFSALDIQRH
jgi:hypothetical protein